MTTNITNAIAAYTAAGKPATAGVDSRTGTDGGFAEMVKDAAGEAIASVREGEEASKAALAGKADIRDVVLAVTNAELTLETVVSLRDKVVNAYNEIIKMPV